MPDTLAYAHADLMEAARILDEAVHAYRAARNVLNAAPESPETWRLVSAAKDAMWAAGAAHRRALRFYEGLRQARHGPPTHGLPLTHNDEAGGEGPAPSHRFPSAEGA